MTTDADLWRLQGELDRVKTRLSTLQRTIPEKRRQIEQAKRDVMRLEGEQSAEVQELQRLGDERSRLERALAKLRSTPSSTVAGPSVIYGKWDFQVRRGRGTYR
jgi:chromosome segregation ATPase